MPRYEIDIDDSCARALGALAEAQRKPIPEVLRGIVLERLQQQPDTDLSVEFKMLVDEVIAENEPVLRRFA